MECVNGEVKKDVEHRKYSIELEFSLDSDRWFGTVKTTSESTEERACKIPPKLPSLRYPQYYLSSSLKNTLHH